MQNEQVIPRTRLQFYHLFPIIVLISMELALLGDGWNNKFWERVTNLSLG